MNIEQMSREAGLWAVPGEILPPDHDRSAPHNRRLEDFARLIAEDCANFADAYAASCESFDNPYGQSAAQDIAENIRKAFCKDTEG